MEASKETRPYFFDALKAWQDVLKQKGFPTDCTWLFDENLCFEKNPEAPEGFRLSYQTQFTPVPAEAERIAYGYFTDFHAPIVFYRLGSAAGSSLCLLLCDDWFQRKTAEEGFVRRDDWLILFRPGGPETIEEVREKDRWEKRLLRDRPLHDLDFCMTLRGVHEILAHGRVLTSYEHYALKFLHVWRRMLGDPH
jgi:hypothetical protein